MRRAAVFTLRFRSRRFVKGPWNRRGNNALSSHETGRPRARDKRKDTQMKPLLLGTALTLSMLGAGAWAQSATGTAPSAAPMDKGVQAMPADAVPSAMSGALASELMGQRVYVRADDVDVRWDDIGEINDIMLSADGGVDAVIIGVGGFLGIGEKDVALDITDLTTMTEGDAEPFFVVEMTRETLENAPAFDPEQRAEAPRATITQ